MEYLKKIGFFFQRRSAEVQLTLTDFSNEAYLLSRATLKQQPNCLYGRVGERTTV